MCFLSVHHINSLRKTIWEIFSQGWIWNWFWYIRDCNPSIKTFRGQMYLGGCFFRFLLTHLSSVQLCSWHSSVPKLLVFHLLCPVCLRNATIPRVSESLQKGHNHDVFSVGGLGGRHTSTGGAPGTKWAAMASSHPDGPLRRPPGLDLEEVKHSCAVERASGSFVTWALTLVLTSQSPLLRYRCYFFNPLFIPIKISYLSKLAPLSRVFHEQHTNAFLLSCISSAALHVLHFSHIVYVVLP